MPKKIYASKEWVEGLLSNIDVETVQPDWN